EILENTGNTENDASGETAATEPLMPPPAYDDSSTDEAAAEPEVPESTAETINVSSVLTGEEDAKALAEEAVSKTSLLEATEENIEQAIKETIDVEELREVVGESAQPSSIEEEEENAEEATEKDADEMVQAISFMLDKEEYAIDVKYLKEIIQTRTLTDVPRAPAGLMGVLSLRGTIVPVINLRFRLGLPEDDNGEQIIIINDGEGYMGLLVDKVNHVLRIKKDTLEPSPSLNTINEDLISALGRHDRGAFILLNIERFLEKA
ncbi:MAG: purine-binding chemotaxis protein CheW, partial [Deltaproteobacteria bacterium]|nr:purine-binding chemotaxis protein CheW [Deltaproteobacteria bacterium]